MDRVILTPGPQIEVTTVRRIYRLFTEDNRSEAQIASALNSESIAAEAGRPWTRGIVHELLTNEKYIGNNIYNRTSAKLQRPRVLNNPEQWIRRDGAYEPVIEAESFAAAQLIISERDRHYTDEELLDRLGVLLRQHGRLSGLIINEAADMPSATTYSHQFQNLRRAYELVRYTPARDYSYLAINRAVRTFHEKHIIQIISQLSTAGARIYRDPTTDLLKVNEEFTTSLSLARCREVREAGHRWIVRFDTSLNPDITIAARMAPGNTVSWTTTFSRAWTSSRTGVDSRGTTALSSTSTAPPTSHPF